ncbi:MAG: hypothetical protein IPK83_04615 [Planctomycetes bacterium]|nr:hypothetical protein [Planctomycetota bacterium]
MAKACTFSFYYYFAVCGLSCRVLRYLLLDYVPAWRTELAGGITVNLYQRSSQYSCSKSILLLIGSLALVIALRLTMGGIPAREYCDYEARKAMGNAKRLGIICYSLNERGLLQELPRYYVDPANSPYLHNMRTWGEGESASVAWHEYLPQSNMVHVHFADREYRHRGELMLAFPDYGPPGDFDRDGSWESIIGYPIINCHTGEHLRYEYAVVKMREDGNVILCMIGVAKNAIGNSYYDAERPRWTDLNGDGIWELSVLVNTKGAAESTQVSLSNWNGRGMATTAGGSKYMKCASRLPVMVNPLAVLTDILSRLECDCRTDSTN